MKYFFIYSFSSFSIILSGFLLIHLLFFPLNTLAQEVSFQELKNAANLINSTRLKKPPYRSRNEMDALLKDIQKEILPYAKQICLEVSIDGNCEWETKMTEINAVNASASGTNEINIYTGLIRNIYSKEELAFVYAHEIAHHIANHVSKSKRDTLLGAIMGAIVGSSLDNGSINDSILLGAQLGNLRYSRNRESQADLIALAILYEADYDLDEASNMLIRLSRLSPGSAFSNWSSSHPSGPERVAIFSRNIKVFEESFKSDEIQ